MVFSVFSWASVEVIVVVNWATGVLRPVRRTGGFCVLCRVVRRNWTVLSWVGGVCGGAVGCGVVVHGTVGVLVVGGVGTRAVGRRVVGVGGRAVGIGIVGMLGNRTAGEAGVVEGTAREVLIVVGSIIFPREGVVLFSYVGRRQPLLLLPSVAEPNSNDFFF